MKYILLSLFLLSFCQRELPTSVGRTQKIVVVTESDVVFDSLSKAIQITYHTPRLEKKFQFLRIDIEKLDKILRFHLIVLINPLNETETGKFIGKLLSPDAEKLIFDEGFSIFQTVDQWAKIQKVIIISARDDTNLI